MLINDNLNFDLTPNPSPSDCDHHYEQILIGDAYDKIFKDENIRNEFVNNINRFKSDTRKKINNNMRIIEDKIGEVGTLISELNGDNTSLLVGYK